MYHFVGIKGSGMSSLACMLKGIGEEVSGSDIEKFIFTQQAVEAAGIPIHSFDEKNIRSEDIIVIGTHFSMSNPEVKAAFERCKEVYWYHEFVGKLMEGYTSFGVCGTHGKTTTTGMLSHMLEKIVPTGYLIGDSTGKLLPEDTNLVVESCEYKRHFLSYHPDYAIVTNIDLDHTDYYKDIADYKDAFTTFANQVKQWVVLFGDDANIRDIEVKTPHLYFGLQEHNDVRAVNIQETEHGMAFDV